MSDQRFTDLVREGGLPTTEAEVRARFEADVAAQNVAFTNNTAFSPWWRMVTTLITQPVMWLIGTLINAVMPQMFVKTASGVFLDLLADGVNVARKQAVKAKGQLQFSRADSTGTLDVPAGTAVQSANINGQVYTLQTTRTVAFDDGQAAVLAPVEALASGSAYNLAEGYYAVLPVLLPGITAVTNVADWLHVPGADEETDNDLRARIRNQFLSVNQWHTDAVYTALISGFEGVKTENVYFNADAPRGPGTADAYVMFETGNPDASFIALIQQKITDEGNHGHGDDVRVFAMPETLHPVSATLYPMENLPSADTAALKTNVEHFIRAAFRENLDYTPTRTRPWSRFSFSRLAQELHAQFPSLLSVAFTTGDITSQMALPRLGMLTVVVS